MNVNVNKIIGINSTLVASTFVYIVPFMLRKKEYELGSEKILPKKS